MTTNNIQRYTVSGDIAYPIHEDPEGDYVTYEDHVAAIEAGRKRRGEPVAWAMFADNGNIRIWARKPMSHPDCVPLYTAPQPAEPVTWPTISNIVGAEYADGTVILHFESDEEAKNARAVIDGAIQIALTFAPQPAENSVNLGVAIQAVSALHSNDTDWDTSYWNRAVERCVSELNKLRSQQPAEPVYTPSTSTDLGDPIETAIKRFELLAANRNHGAVDPLVGAMELRAYKDSLAPQPAELGSCPHAYSQWLADSSNTHSWQLSEAFSGGWNMASMYLLTESPQPTEPVKVPSEAQEIRRLYRAIYKAMERLGEMLDKEQYGVIDRLLTDEGVEPPSTPEPPTSD